MPAYVLQVTKAEPHPNADALRIYQMEAPEIASRQIIANLENVYEVDDCVVVVLSGSVLKDGTKIKEAKIRGLPSYGMAVSKVINIVGTDLTDQWCQENISSDGAQHIRWPEIEGLATVRRNLDEMKANLETFEIPKVKYKAKIKLHGTNAAVQVHPDGKVFAQSRTGIITTESDNAGFAAWVEKNIDYWKAFVRDNIVTFFGEWIGPGINKSKTAVCQIENKCFAVFAIQIGGPSDVQYYQVEPAVIADWLWPHYEREASKDVLAKDITFTDHNEVFVIPWYNDETFELDYTNRGKLAAAAEPINELVAQIDKLDPWVDAVFNVQGAGEGLVFYPVLVNGSTPETREDHSEYFFKAKGEKHKVVKQKQPVQIDPEIAKSIDDFADMFVTVERCEQGVLAACDGKYDMRKTGDFLKWIGQDIKKESVAELEASKLEWKQVTKAVTQLAGQWYKNKANEV